MRFSTTIPAMPVQDAEAGAAFYAERLGFEIAFVTDGFSRLVRDEAEIHLWAASDEGWRARADLVDNPVCSGAETFIAGTASCRIQVDSGIDDLYAEMRQSDVLHPTDPGSATDTDWATREFAALDLAGNLLVFFQRV